MTKAQIIARLAEYPDDQEIMILDSFNGAGIPREINLISTRAITIKNAEETVDCEDIVGQEVIVLGFGCY